MNESLKSLLLNLPRWRALPTTTARTAAGYYFQEYDKSWKSNRYIVILIHVATILVQRLFFYLLLATEKSRNHFGTIHKKKLVATHDSLLLVLRKRLRAQEDSTARSSTPDSKEIKVTYWDESCLFIFSRPWWRGKINLFTWMVTWKLQPSRSHCEECDST